MTTANELIRDAVIRRQIYLMRFSARLTREIIALLDATEDDLAGKIERRLARLVEKGVDSGKLTTARLKVLRRLLKAVRDAAWDKVEERWMTHLRELADDEVSFIDEVFKEHAPVLLETILPTATQLAATVNVKPLSGRPMRAWIKKIAQDDLDRIMTQIRIGLTQGETTAEIAKRIIGIAALKGANGVTEITRRDAASITLTAVNHVTNQSKRAFFAANSDIFTEEAYVATLDARTTPVCRSLDGKTFPVGQGPIPPLHWKCRSIRVAVIDGGLIGDRPAVAASESTLSGLSNKDRRAKIRELTGQVPAATTYQEWLTRQTGAFQNDVLGTRRAQLFRKGGLTLDRFVDKKGREYTLAELRQREPEAWKRAGFVQN
jgi:SPP1 gp7 family putative phage head morphogenesis protein